MAVKEALQIAVKRIEVKSKGEKERYKHLNAEKIARRDKKASSVIKAKKQRKKTEWERLEISSRKSQISKEHFMQDGLDKGQTWYGPNRSRRY